MALSGWTIRAYADTNGNGILEAGETTVACHRHDGFVTGAYSLTLNPGSYVICERIDDKPGYSQTQPNPTAAPIRCGDLPAGQGVAPGGYPVTVTGGSATANQDFGNRQKGTIEAQEGLGRHRRQRHAQDRYVGRTATRSTRRR